MLPFCHWREGSRIRVLYPNILHYSFNRYQLPATFFKWFSFNCNWKGSFMTFKFFKNNEYNTNANAYSNHFTGFRIKSGMTKESVSSLYTPSLSSLGERSAPLSSLGEGRSPETRGSINNDINILVSRVFADATHKNDRKRNVDAIHKDDSQVCESDCTTPLSFLRKRESSVHKHYNLSHFNYGTFAVCQ